MFRKEFTELSKRQRSRSLALEIKKLKLEHGLGEDTDLTFHNDNIDKEFVGLLSLTTVLQILVLIS